MTSIIPSELSWSAIIVILWLALVGPGNIEGYLFPAAAPMELKRAVPTNLMLANEQHQNFDAVASPNGRYTAIWLKSARLRHPGCTPEHLEWRLGDRNGNHAPVDWHWGPPEVKGDGEFSAGPWIIHLKVSQLHNSFSDVFHQCRILGLKLPWLTKSRFWN